MRPAPEFHNRRLFGFALDALLYVSVYLVIVAPLAGLVRDVVLGAGE